MNGFRYPKCAAIAVILLALGGCHKSDLGEPLTVGQYLHDVDLVESILKKGSSNPAKYGNDPAYENASAAKAEFFGFGGPNSINECWHHKETTTANTDHACVDVWVKKNLKE